MRIHDLFEAKDTMVDRERVIATMLHALNAGRHWDTMTKHRLGDDNIYDMLETFRDELPSEVQGLAPDDVIKTPEFQKLLRGWCEGRFDEVRQKLARIPSVGGRYKVHRIIKVRRDWFKDVRRQGGTSLGIYWTYDLAGWDAEIGVYPVWAKKNLRGPELLIEATVAPRSVDWFHTFLANMDWYSGDREFEMTIKAGAPVTVLSIVEEGASQPLDTRGLRFVA